MINNIEAIVAQFGHGRSLSSQSQKSFQMSFNRFSLLNFPC